MPKLVERRFPDNTPVTVNEWNHAEIEDFWSKTSIVWRSDALDYYRTHHISPVRVPLPDGIEYLLSCEQHHATGGLNNSLGEKLVAEEIGDWVQSGKTATRTALKQKISIRTNKKT